MHGPQPDGDLQFSREPIPKFSARQRTQLGVIFNQHRGERSQPGCDVRMVAARNGLGVEEVAAVVELDRRGTRQARQGVVDLGHNMVPRPLPSN